jgi:hypothetical protein
LPRNAQKRTKKKKKKKKVRTYFFLRAGADVRRFLGVFFLSPLGMLGLMCVSEWRWWTGTGGDGCCSEVSGKLLSRCPTKCVCVVCAWMGGGCMSVYHERLVATRLGRRVGSWYAAGWVAAGMTEVLQGPGKAATGRRLGSSPRSPAALRG